jgi:hypothetical protein
MKRIFFLLFPLFLFACGAAANKRAAIDYNDAIVGEQNKIIEHTLAMSNSTYDIAVADEHRLKIIEQCDASIAVVGAMEPFDGNYDLRDAALNLFKFYKEISTEDFKNILEILAMEEISDEDYQQLEAIDASISKREAPLDAAFKKAQKAFSEKYNIELLKNEYQDALDGV